jgi:hypothetical protein
VVGYYSATRQHNAAAPLADFCTAAYTRRAEPKKQAKARRRTPRKAKPLLKVVGG